MSISKKIYLDVLQQSVFSIMETGLHDKRLRAHLKDPTLDESHLTVAEQVSLKRPNHKPEGFSSEKPSESGSLQPLKPKPLNPKRLNPKPLNP